MARNRYGDVTIQACGVSYDPGGGSCCTVQVLPSGSVNQVNDPQASVLTSATGFNLSSSQLHHHPALTGRYSS